MSRTDNLYALWLIWEQAALSLFKIQPAAAGDPWIYSDCQSEVGSPRNKTIAHFLGIRHTLAFEYKKHRHQACDTLLQNLTWGRSSLLVRFARLQSSGKHHMKKNRCGKTSVREKRVTCGDFFERCLDHHVIHNPLGFLYPVSTFESSEPSEPDK